MLTIPKEITEPGREIDIKRCSPSTGLVSSTAGSSAGSSIIDICLEPRRGGGERGVSAVWASIGGCERAEGGGGKGDMVGVCICKKLGSS